MVDFCGECNILLREWDIYCAECGEYIGEREKPEKEKCPACSGMHAKSANYCSKEGYNIKRFKIEKSRFDREYGGSKRLFLFRCRLIWALLIAWLIILSIVDTMIGVDSFVFYVMAMFACVIVTIIERDRYFGRYQQIWQEKLKVANLRKGEG